MTINNMGWICPVCGAGNNPAMFQCVCGGQTISASNTDQLRGKHMFWQALPETDALKFGATVEGGTPNPSNVMVMDVPKVREPFTIDTSDDPPHIKIYLPDNCPDDVKAGFDLNAEVRFHAVIPHGKTIPNDLRERFMDVLNMFACESSWDWQIWLNKNEEREVVTLFREKK